MAGVAEVAGGVMPAPQDLPVLREVQAESIELVEESDQAAVR